ncbi:MAG: hypothetical protein FVQ80_09140 [Planctomycetes bacterium]|nr:hypothetical protein [Planctomycetota bacterium]
MGKYTRSNNFVVGFWVVFLILGLLGGVANSRDSKSPVAIALDHPIIFTQLPLGTDAQQKGSLAHGTLRADYGDGARLVKLSPDLSIQVLSEGFHSASDPEISFDGSKILFAGKRNAADNWNIFEMSSDGSNIRQVTRETMDCRSPGYQATFYTIVSSEPWYQLNFVGSKKEYTNEFGEGAVSNLYSCKIDGSGLRQLTYNLSSDKDPFIMPDGRLIFSSWQRAKLNRTASGRIVLLGINVDGTDLAPFCTDEGKRIKQMPCTTTNRLAVFVEADSVPWDGGGSLGSVSLRRPLHSYKPITKKTDGLFHTPSPLPDGRILVSRRSPDNSDSYGIYKLDPANGQYKLIYDGLGFHDIQAKSLQPRTEPDGRSSVVTEKDPLGKLYCLNVYTSDLENPEWLEKGSVKKIRILEGLPLRADQAEQNPPFHGIPPMAQRRILGEVDVSSDGSFNLVVPASIPIQIQTLDENGMALKTCNWIWVKNHESRGCIGCHEDNELTPENVLVEAIKKPAIELDIPPKDRRVVDFRRDVIPVIKAKCVSCHNMGGSIGPLYTFEVYKKLLGTDDSSSIGKYVHPGRARTSPLIWHIFGKNTSRPWDDKAGQDQMPRMSEDKSLQLTDQEKKVFIEWIDSGALFDGIVRQNNSSKK